MKLIMSCLIAAILALPAAAQVKAEVALRAAMESETVKGDLKSAIEQYKKILVSYAGNRPVAAQALFHLGACYEKLGDQQARQVYERLLHDYPDQTETTASARAKLAGLTAESGPDTTVRRLPLADGLGDGWCVSPDGRYAAFSDGPQDISNLALLDLTSGTRRTLTHGASNTQGTEECAFSPDGKRIAFVWSHPGPGDTDELRLVNLDGTGERVLYRYRTMGMYDWRGDTIVLTIDNDSRATQPVRIVLISATDGAVRVLKTGGQLGGSAFLSPDGRWLAGSVIAPRRAPQQDISLISIADGTEFTLLSQPGDNKVVGWTPDGRSVLFTTDKDVSTDLYGLRMEGAKLSGAPFLIRHNIGAMDAKRVTSRGAIYFANLRDDAVDVYTASLDPETGRITSPALATRRKIGKNQYPTWSPDGARLAYQTNLPRSAAPAVTPATMAFLDLATGAVQELVPPLFNFRLMRWRPDGKTLLVQGQSEPGNQGLFELDPKTGEVKALVRNEKPGSYALAGPLWLPDGKSILYANANSILQRTLENGQTKELYRGTDLTGASLALSTDGRWLAFLTGGNEGRTGGDTLMVMPVSGDEPRTILRLPSGERFENPQGIAWMRNGRQILFSKHVPNRRGALPVSIWSMPVDGGEPVNTGLSLKDLGVWSKTMDALRIDSLSVDPSGRRIAFSVGPTHTDEAWVLEGLPGKN